MHALQVKPLPYRMLKRSTDVVCAVVGLCVLAPVLGLVGLAVLFTMGRPILFRQARAGWGERVFILVKFRTMRPAPDRSGRALSDAERLTRLGAFLRRWSLDELPQLWNVLKGDMSLVGPRPLLVDYLDRYSPVQRRRHEVRPGITGWAQVHGRNGLDWEERFQHDVWYVDHASAGLDFKILVKTLAVAVSSRGISASQHATMPEFEGTAANRRERTKADASQLSPTP